MMKRKIAIFCVALFSLCMVNKLNAQDYKHAIGGTVGSMFGVNYTYFFTDNMGIQTDLGVKINTLGRLMGMCWSLDLNPNFIYQSPIGNSNFSWLAGGGLSLGYAFSSIAFGYSGYFSLGKFGVNAIGGVEYIFNAVPLALQWNFRPGYGMLFDSVSTLDYFDWTTAFTLKYTF